MFWVESLVGTYLLSQLLANKHPPSLFCFTSKQPQRCSYFCLREDRLQCCNWMYVACTKQEDDIRSVRRVFWDQLIYCISRINNSVRACRSQAFRGRGDSAIGDKLKSCQQIHSVIRVIIKSLGNVEIQACLCCLFDFVKTPRPYIHTKSE